MLAKQLRKKWPNFCLSENHPDDNLKQIGAPFFSPNYTLLNTCEMPHTRYFWNCWFLTAKKTVQFVRTANKVIIHKSRGEQFLWNRNRDLCWI
jgi:hypothetical protein